MNSPIIDIPADYTEFLHWIKEKTEFYWSLPPGIATGFMPCEEWIRGAKWQGLTYEQIDDLERKYEITFMPEHREFLHVLHAIDKYEVITHEFEADDQELTEVEIRPLFYNWVTDHSRIKKYLDWPFREISSDIVSKVQPVWLESWGARPATDEEALGHFEMWYNAAPTLLPIGAHTFIVSDIDLKRRPLLSVWGTDVIIAGWSFKAYLISKFSDALGLTAQVYDKEDDMLYWALKDIVFEPPLAAYFEFRLVHPIPYWDEMILYRNSQFHKVGEDM